MTDRIEQDENTERAITRALEQRREVAVPEGFAARVRASLPAQPRVRRRVSAGKLAAVAMAVLATSAMFAVAPYMSAGFMNPAFDLECLLMVQVAGIMSWLAARRES